MLEDFDKRSRDIRGCNKPLAWKPRAFVHDQSGKGREIMDETVRLNLLEDAAEAGGVHSRKLADDLVCEDLAVTGGQTEYWPGLPCTFGQVH